MNLMAIAFILYTDARRWFTSDSSGWTIDNHFISPSDVICFLYPGPIPKTSWLEYHTLQGSSYNFITSNNCSFGGPMIYMDTMGNTILITNTSTMLGTTKCLL